MFLTELCRNIWRCLGTHLSSYLPHHLLSVQSVMSSELFTTQFKPRPGVDFINFFVPYALAQIIDIALYICAYAQLLRQEKASQKLGVGRKRVYEIDNGQTVFSSFSGWRHVVGRRANSYRRCDESTSRSGRSSSTTTCQTTLRSASGANCSRTHRQDSHGIAGENFCIFTLTCTS